MIYLFDVDGTLTSARKEIEPKHDLIFKDFIEKNEVYLVTGSDLPKIKEQLPEEILNDIKGIFCCLGNVLYQNNKEVYKNTPKWSEELLYLCKDYYVRSIYHTKTGNHIEKRIGIINISSVGRNAGNYDRKTYEEWDCIHHERRSFADYINNKLSHYEASIGGSISIDISVRGQNKSQVLRWFRKNGVKEPISFFGDKVSQGGNDHPLAIALEDENSNNKIYKINQYSETFDKIQEIMLYNSNSK